MKASHYIAIGIRFFAVLVFLLAFREALHLPELFLNGTIDGMQASLSYSVLSFSITLIFAIALWMFPSLIAKSIIRSEMDHEIQPVNPIEFSTVVISGLGLYLFYHVISDAIYWFTVVNIGQETSYGTVPFALDNYSKAEIVATGFEFLLSLSLILWSRSIAKLVLKVAK